MHLEFQSSGELCFSFCAVDSSSSLNRFFLLTPCKIHANINPASRAQFLASPESRGTIKSRIPSLNLSFSRFPHRILVKSRILKIPSRPWSMDLPPKFILIDSNSHLVHDPLNVFIKFLSFAISQFYKETSAFLVRSPSIYVRHLNEYLEIQLMHQ